MDDLATIARLIDALRPWLGELVIVGGWAHRLYRLTPQSGHLTYMPLRTRDADVAFSLDARLTGDIGAALKATGFHEDFSDAQTPPIAQYRLGDEDHGFYAEFLVPLQGSGMKRNGTADATVAKAGITAQKLRHLDLLLMHTWQVHLGVAEGVPLTPSADVRLPNPVGFIAQKLLIQKRRTPEKRAQDTLYVHDTLEMFGGELGTLRRVWSEEMRPVLPKTLVSELDQVRQEYFGAVTDVIRTAARIPGDRTLRADRMQAACAYGLEEIFSAR